MMAKFTVACWGVITYDLADGCEYYGGIYCLYLQDKR
jgi:hypothetical protein